MRSASTRPPPSSSTASPTTPPSHRSRGCGRPRAGPTAPGPPSGRAHDSSPSARRPPRTPATSPRPTPAPPPTLTPIEPRSPPPTPTTPPSSTLAGSHRHDDRILVHVEDHRLDHHARQPQDPLAYAGVPHPVLPPVPSRQTALKRKKQTECNR